jgi:cytochrome oxidase Cu insertion factor (SCO1/SenC/PrrC family)
MFFNRTLNSVVAASLLLLGLGSVQAASPVPVGQTAPKFELKNQKGTAISLADLAKKKRVALVFYRSADW